MASSISPPTGAPIILQLTGTGHPMQPCRFAAGRDDLHRGGGFGLPALRAGDQLSLDIDGVGTNVPGSDLNLIMRL